MPYFTVMAELRGCYSDSDSAFITRADTRRELKEIISGEAAHLREAGAIGLSKRDVASLAALVWRNRRGPCPYPFVLPFGYPQHEGGKPWGIMVSPATRAEWREYNADV